MQALHLAAHSGHVVATDVNQRALGIARFNAVLNEVGDRVEVREGSFFEPVRGERYDLIATNPPFVISPATGERLVYRDSGLPGDQVVEDIVRAAPDHLTERGWCQVLANWVVERNRPWDERLAGWLGPDVDALVVQRELVDPAAYVELWLKDSGHHPATGGDPAEYRRRYDTWLAWLEEQRVEAIGFGWVNLRNGGTGRHDLWDWPYDVEQPIAPAIADWADGVTTDAGADARLRLREDVVQETVGPAGAEDPATIVLRQQRGFRRARQADTVVAALVGACDGELRDRSAARCRRPAARPGPGRDPRDVPPGRPGAGRRGLPRLDRRCDVGVREVVTLEQQWFTADLGERVGHAVTEVEPGRRARLLAEPGVRLACNPVPALSRKERRRSRCRRAGHRRADGGAPGTTMAISSAVVAEILVG